jgi:hypothetical protein
MAPRVSLGTTAGPESGALTTTQPSCSIMVDEGLTRGNYKPMSEHRFKIGQPVEYYPPHRMYAPRGAYHVTYLEDKTHDLEDKTKEIEQRVKRGADAVKFAEEILRGLRLSSIQVAEFQQALNGATSFARYEIAHRADENRRQNWENNKDVMELSLPLFETLVRHEEAEKAYWWHASLAYCLKDKINPDYSKAVTHLDKAIEIRGNETRSGAYEFNRAICLIHLAARLTDQNLSQATNEKIRRDLETANRFPRFSEIAKKDATVQHWLQSQKDRA